MQNTKNIIRDKILTPLAESNYNNEQELSLFTAQKGGRYNGGLMIVGRAVNGWDDQFSINSLEVEDLTKVVAQDTGNDCPLAWIAESWGREDGTYNPARSAFWRLAKKFSEEFSTFGDDHECWSSYLAWTNLYKIAPASEGNPSNKLCDLQFEGCNLLLLEEIKRLKPKRIIFMTGFNWFDGFLDESTEIQMTSDMALAEAFGTIEVEDQNIPFVVAKHPQGKDSATLKREVLSLFDS